MQTKNRASLSYVTMAGLAVVFRRLDYLDLAVRPPTNSEEKLPICPFHAQQKIIEAVVTAAVTDRLDYTVYTLIDRAWAAGQAGTYRRMRLLNTKTPPSIPSWLKSHPNNQPMEVTPTESTNVLNTPPPLRRKKARPSPPPPTRNMTRIFLEAGIQLLLVVGTAYFLQPGYFCEAAPLQMTLATDVQFRAVDCDNAKVVDVYSAHEQVDCDDKEETPDQPQVDYTLVERFKADSTPGF